MRQYVLGDIAHFTGMHYHSLYREKLSHLSAFEQIEHINRCCELEEEITGCHWPTRLSVQSYLNIVYDELILDDFDGILQKKNGFKHVLTSFIYNSDNLKTQLQLYFKIFRRVEE